ncbi:LmbU family transcriptional regulator [Streptomyces sp. NBC_00687]|uniref:LmbU family transcriptional regulator n=1 Tax=Streptomyces sp. NBC_00687 TaxID=2975807 RepID=UPI002256E34F|nr:LmbU family transcriptional regulator [Streptomyces sp. NBC_00687]MCX4920127.1 LmbU family transcriptional regulator [Streptomyces sp. NBC_00687]
MMEHQAGRTAGSHGGPATALAQGAPQQPRTVAAGARRGQVLTTRVGLQMPELMAYDEWERAGRQLADVLDSSSWWLGDWLVYGKDHYTDRYQRGIRAVGLSYQTLRNYAWVSRRFPLARRRAGLSFQHHAELASMPAEEQDRWLERAERQRWTTKQLRSALRAARRSEQQPPAAAAEEAAQRLDLPGSRLQWWHRAAEQLGVDFEQWVTATLDSAAATALRDPDAPGDCAEHPQHAQDAQHVQDPQDASEGQDGLVGGREAVAGVQGVAARGAAAVSPAVAPGGGRVVRVRAVAVSA